MSTTVSADLFKNLINMVAENYTINSKEKLEVFQSGVSQFTQFIFLQDSIIDNDVNWIKEFENKENNLYTSNHMFRTAIQNLGLIFPTTHSFWNYLSTEEQHYYNYITKEKYLSIKKGVVKISDFEEMAYAKHCLALVPLQGMEWLFESKHPHEKIKQLFLPIFNGIQMMDDIDDFSKDLHHGQWNLIQYEVQQIIKDEQLINDGSLDKFEERVFYASEICLKYSHYVLDQYEKALKLSKELGFQAVEIWLTTMISEIKESIIEVEQIME